MKVELILPKKLFEPTRYKLLEDFKYKNITVPKGFITDGASVPRVFWPLFPPTGRYFIAAVIHDYMLESNPYIPEYWDKANETFKDVLLHYNVNKHVVRILYLAVKLHFSKKKILYKLKGDENAK